MPVLEINEEQVEYIQTIGQGWAYPLSRFMNESEVLEVTQFRTLTDAYTGEKVLMSVPITQPVTLNEKKDLENKPNIALKCSKLSDTVLAVIE